MRSVAMPVALFALSALSCLAQAPVAVINYAGFNRFAPVAPGSIASAYGNFGSVTTTAWNAANPPMPRSLANVSVRVANLEAPLYFVSSSQINFNIPVAAPVGRQQVQVLLGSQVIAQGNVEIYDYFPGLAARDTSATRPGVILNQDNSDNLATPAARGSVIQLFATGCGLTNPAQQDGVPTGAAAASVATVRAYVSVEDADVVYAGAQPQFPGVCQVNIRIPDRPHITGVLDLFITVNGVASNPVTVRVQ